MHPARDDHGVNAVVENDQLDPRTEILFETQGPGHNSIAQPLDPEYLKSISRMLKYATIIRNKFDEFDPPVTAQSLLEDATFVSLLVKANLSKFKLSLESLRMSSPEITIKNSDVLVKWMYKSENVFRFDDKIEIQAVIAHYLSIRTDYPQYLAPELCRYYLTYWNPRAVFETDRLAGFIKDKKEKGLLEYILSRKAQDYPKTPPVGAPEAFAVDFRHSDSALAYFTHFVLHDILDAYINDSSGNYHSLYFSIVQSSLFGKTRLVLEAGASGLNVVYCCLRPSDSSGYPLTNENVDSFFRQHWQVPHLELFIVCTYLVAYDYFNPSESVNDGKPPLSKLETGNNVKFIEFWNTVLALFQECIENEEEEAKKRKLFSDLQAIKRPDDNSFYSDVMVDGKKRKVPSHLLVVFDESRWMLDFGSESTTLFRNLRNAHQNLNSRNCVLVFIDTLSSVSHFQPAWSKDPSHRPTDERCRQLPPFYEILTADPNSSTLIADPNRYPMLAQIFSFGRPGWQALFFRNLPEVRLTDLHNALYYAKEKLTLRFKVEPLSEGAIVAVLAIRFGIIGISDHSLASTLIASHLGTGVYIGEDRLRMTVQYISEPILAEAACQVLHGTVSMGSTANVKMDWNYPDNEFNYEQISSFLDALCNKYVSGLVDVGELGELLSRIILSLSYDFARMTMIRPNGSSGNAPSLPEPYAKNVIGLDSFFTDSISLEIFLSVLIPDSYRKEWNFPLINGKYSLPGIPDSDLTNSHIALTSWIRLASSNAKMFSQDNLQNFYYRRCGIILPENHKGADLVIPTYNHVKKSYSYIVVQVKNRKKYGQDRCDSAEKELSPVHCFMPESQVSDYIGLYMEVDYKKRDQGDNSMTVEDENEGDEGYKPMDMDHGNNGNTPDEDEDSKILKRAARKAELASKMAVLRLNYPRHILLLGIPQVFWGNAKLKESMENLQQSRVDFIDSVSRCLLLRRMNTVSYMFEKGCSCIKTNCSTRRCSCVKSYVGCSENCHPGRIEMLCSNSHLKAVHN